MNIGQIPADLPIQPNANGIVEYKGNTYDAKNVETLPNGSIVLRNDTISGSDKEVVFAKGPDGTWIDHHANSAQLDKPANVSKWAMSPHLLSALVVFLDLTQKKMEMSDTLGKMVIEQLDIIFKMAEKQGDMAIKMAEMRVAKAEIALTYAIVGAAISGVALVGSSATLFGRQTQPGLAGTKGGMGHATGAVGRRLPGPLRNQGTFGMSLSATQTQAMSTLGSQIGQMGASIGTIKYETEEAKAQALSKLFEAAQQFAQQTLNALKEEQKSDADAHSAQQQFVTQLRAALTEAWRA